MVVKTVEQKLTLVCAPRTRHLLTNEIVLRDYHVRFGQHGLSSVCAQSPVQNIKMEHVQMWMGYERVRDHV